MNHAITVSYMALINTRLILARDGQVSTNFHVFAVELESEWLLWIPK